MKKKLLLLSLIILSLHGTSQVAVNTDGSEPDASAMLDVSSTEKGMLVPRMTSAKRDNISDPATGLLVFCTDDNNFYMNEGTPATPDWQVMSSQWVSSGSKIYFNSGNVGIGNSNPGIKLQVQGKIGAAWGNTSTPSFVFGTGTESTGFSSPSSNEIAVINNGNESARFDNSGRLGLGTDNPDASAQLEIASTSRGFLPPRMSTTQREDISNPPAGLMVYDTSLNNVFFYDGSSWQSTSNRDGMSCGNVNYDGQTYNTVIIGNQCWMTENLNIGTSILGTNDQTDNGLIEKYCYDNDEDNCDDYGGLYQWDEAMQYTTTVGAQGICPDGWHLPTDAEITDLYQYLGGLSLAGGKLKSTRTEPTYHPRWDSPNNNATNETGYAALPGGYRSSSDGSFGSLGSHYTSWMSEEQSPGSTNAWRFFISNTNGYFQYSTTHKTAGQSVRCIKN